MDETTYKQWHALHIKHAVGETLTPDEQAIYDAGCEQLDAEEMLELDTGLRQKREEIERLKAENQRLHAVREQLEARAVALERELSAITKQLVRVGD